MIEISSDFKTSTGAICSHRILDCFFVHQHIGEYFQLHLRQLCAVQVYWNCREISTNFRCAISSIWDTWANTQRRQAAKPDFFSSLMYTAEEFFLEQTQLETKRRMKFFFSPTHRYGFFLFLCDCCATLTDWRFPCGELLRAVRLRENPLEIFTTITCADVVLFSPAVCLRL